MTSTEAVPIATGTRAFGIAITSTTAYVTNQSSSNVTPINLGTDTPGTPITVGRQPQGIAITTATQTTPTESPGVSGDSVF